MPNHVTNRLRIYGSLFDRKLTAGLLRHVDEESREMTEVSFQTLIPMPKIISQIEISNETEIGYYAITGKDTIPDWGLPQRRSIEKYLETIPDDELDDLDLLMDYLEKKKPEALRNGMMVIKALRETGHSNWYRWSIENWGTKWDAYNSSVVEEETCTVITFDTAWNPPFPVITKLTDLMPKTVSLEHDYFDEGHNFWGTQTFRSDQSYSHRQSLPEDQRVLCMALKGYDPDIPENCPKRLTCHVSMHLEKRLPADHAYRHRYDRLLAEISPTYTH